MVPGARAWLRCGCVGGVRVGCVVVRRFGGAWCVGGLPFREAWWCLVVVVWLCGCVVVWLLWRRCCVRREPWRGAPLLFMTAGFPTTLFLSPFSPLVLVLIGQFHSLQIPTCRLPKSISSQQATTLGGHNRRRSKTSKAPSTQRTCAAPTHSRDVPLTLPRVRRCRRRHRPQHRRDTPPRNPTPPPPRARQLGQNIINAQYGCPGGGVFEVNRRT
jgi:hypothetical protein